jgi:uncharacterized protein YecE (DUF72 family)
LADLDNIKIGTSGYSFLDWIGPFYPKGIEKSEMLNYYVQHFDIVEIDSSYHSIPPAKVFESMERKTPEGFGFMVRTHKSITHERTDILAIVDKFKKSVSPLVEAGKLRGLLLQFPYSFRWSQKNLTYLTRVRDLLHGYPMYFEFWHRGWQRDEVFKLFEESKLYFCSVDVPQIDALPRPEVFNTADRIYIRLHGRNAVQWWRDGPLRYDYLYTDIELKRWIRRIRGVREKITEKYIFFNNCYAGQAVQNVREMTELLRLELEKKERANATT